MSIADKNTTEAKHGPVMVEESMKKIVNYDGLVLTSIDVESSPTEDKLNRVTFSDATLGSREDKDAVFLRNIREVSRKGEGWKTVVDFEAELVTFEEALAAATAGTDKCSKRKPFFVVHGFNTNASFHLLDCLQAQSKLSKAYIIPVIWPSTGSGSLFDYKTDRALSKAAGESFRSSMLEPMRALTAVGGASIMCHSMGNRVFRNFATGSDICFDNIFMVAADVDGDLFHEAYIHGSWSLLYRYAEWRQHGINIKNMLSHDGKVHVIYNPSDVRLSQSMLMKFGNTRLGAEGVNFGWDWLGYTVHPKLKDSIVNVNAHEHDMMYENMCDHNYHFHDNVCKYYENQM